MRWAAILAGVLCSLPFPAAAQSLTDLSGPWAIVSDRAPAGQISFPFAGVPQPLGRYQLRRETSVSETTGIALMVPPLLGSYVVSVNNVEIGRYGEMGNRFTPRPLFRVYSIPAGALHAGSNSIAIDIDNQTGASRGLLTAGDADPKLGPEGLLRELAEGKTRTAQLTRVHTWLTLVLDLLLAALLLLISRTSRMRPALLWTLGYLLLCVVFGLILGLGDYTGSPPVIFLDWAVIGTVAFASAWSCESLIFFLALRIPGWLRVAYYSVVLVAVAMRGIEAPIRLLDPVFLLICAGIALRRGNRTALAFAVLMLGYLVLPLGLGGLPRFVRLDIVYFNLVPLYRNAFSVLLVLVAIRQATYDRAERERLGAEFEAARMLQSMLLRAPSLDAASVEAVYLPAQEVGGDFYHVIDGSLLLVGDVSGKGLRASMVVSLLIGVLRGMRERRPAAVLSELNRALAGQVSGGFVTCCCAGFGADGTVSIANAGHLAPYCDGREVELEPGLPLGIDPEVSYTESTVRGKAFTFISDGVVEAANAAGELFGFERTREMSRRSAAEIAEAARAWGQNDDITVVTVRRAA